MGSRATHHLRGDQLHPVKHSGFKAVQQEIAAREGLPPDRAGAILASRSRQASSAAKKKNPRLKRVKSVILT